MHQTLLKREIERVKSQKIVLVLCAIFLLLAVFLCFLYPKQNTENGYTVQAYHEAEKDVFSHPEAQQIPYLNHVIQEKKALLNTAYAQMTQDTQNNAQNVLALHYQGKMYQDILKYVEDTQRYASYMDDIQKQQKKMLVLANRMGKNTYNEKNLKSIHNAYSNLVLVTPKTDAISGVLFIKHMSGAFYLTIAFVFILSFVLVTSEKSYHALYGTMVHGKKGLTNAKLSTLLLYTWAMALGMICIYVVFAQNMFGLGALNRPIQSVFFMCPLKISVGAYVLWMCVYYLIVVTLYAFLVFVLCSYLPNISSSMGVFLLLILVGFVMTQFIGDHSVFQILKYVNFYAILDATPLLTRYTTIRLFNTPFQLMYVLPIAVALEMVCMCALIKISPRFHIQRWKIKKSKRKRVFLKPHVCLWKHELYRIFIGKRVVLLLLVFVVFESILAISTPLYQSNYQSQLQGFVEASSKQNAPVEYLKNKQEKLIRAGKNNNTTALALSKALKQAEYAQTHHVPMVYDGGYQKLLEDKTSQFMRMLMITVFIVLCIFQLTETKCDALYATLLYGKTKKKVYIYLFLFAIVCFIFAWHVGIEVIKISHTYGLERQDASANAVEFLQVYKNLSLKEYMLYVFSAQAFCYALFAWLFYLMCRKNIIVALSVYLIVFFIPLLLSCTGFTLFQNYIVFQLFNGDIFLKALFAV